MTYRRLLPELEAYLGPSHEMLDEPIMQNACGAWIPCSEYLASQRLRSVLRQLCSKGRKPQPIPYFVK